MLSWLGKHRQFRPARRAGSCRGKVFPRVRVCSVSPSPFSRGHPATPRCAARILFQSTGRSVPQLTRRSRSLRSLRDGALPLRRDGRPSAPPRAPSLAFARCAGTSAAKAQHALISKCRRRRRGRFSSCKSNPPRRYCSLRCAPPCADGAGLRHPPGAADFSVRLGWGPRSAARYTCALVGALISPPKS